MALIRLPAPSRVLGVVFLLGGVMVLTGCSGKPKGTVEGVVKFKGQPVTTGSVNFYIPDKGIGDSANLDASGNYKFATPMDVGDYKVFFQPPPPQQLPPGSKQAKDPFPIPRKYQSPTTTSLSKEVKAGKNEFPLDVPN